VQLSCASASELANCTVQPLASCSSYAAVRCRSKSHAHERRGPCTCTALRLLLLIPSAVLPDEAPLNDLATSFAPYVWLDADGAWGSIVAQDPADEAALGFVFAASRADGDVVPVCVSDFTAPWTDSAATVACRQAGYTRGSAGAVPSEALNEQQLSLLRGSQALLSADCPPAARSMADCTSSLAPVELCSSVATVTCSNGELAGDAPCSGLEGSAGPLLTASWFIAPQIHQISRLCCKAAPTAHQAEVGAAPVHALFLHAVKQAQVPL
jgi:hypothetical protein